MNYDFELSLRAEKNIYNAFEWYEEQREGLGDTFLEVVDKEFLSIQSNPSTYGFRKGKIRGCITKGFPYLILYYVKRKNIRVVSVFHMSKKHGK